MITAAALDSNDATSHVTADLLLVLNRMPLLLNVNSTNFFLVFNNPPTSEIQYVSPLILSLRSVNLYSMYL